MAFDDHLKFDSISAERPESLAMNSESSYHMVIVILRHTRPLKPDSLFRKYLSRRAVVLGARDRNPKQLALVQKRSAIYSSRQCCMLVQIFVPSFARQSNPCMHCP